MKRFIRILFLSLTLLLVCPKAQVFAIDPVTLAILAPIALQMADAARPYVAKGLINFGKGLLKAGICMFQVFFIPYGMAKMIFFSPWGEFHSGLVYTMRGGIALLKTVGHLMLLPVYLFGVNINIGTA